MDELTGHGSNASDVDEVPETTEDTKIQIQAKTHKGKGRGRVMGKTFNKMMIVKTVTTVKKTMVCNAELCFMSQIHNSFEKF